MAGIVSLGFNIFANDLASPQFARVAASAQGSAAKSHAAWRKAGLGIAAAGVVIGGALLKTGKTFDEMRDTIIRGTGASGKALKGMERIATEIGKDTPSSFQDIGTAVSELNTRLGLTGRPLGAVGRMMLNVSRVAGVDLKNNIAASSRVFGDWGVKVNEMPKALDFLFKVSQTTGIGLTDLQRKIVEFGAPLRQFGFTMEESAALMGKWEKEGVNLEAVLAGMKIGLGNMADAGKEPEKALLAVQKAIMGAGSAGEANRLAIETFGKRAGPDMAAAIREGRFEISDLMKTLKDSSGSIRDADERTRSWQESWQILKNKGLLLIKPAAERVFELFSDFVSWLERDGVPLFQRDVLPVLKRLGGALSDVTGFLWKNREAVKAALVAFTALYAINRVHTAFLAIQAAGGLAKYIRATKIVTSVTKTWTAVQWALNAAHLANPIGAVILVIGALVAGIIVAYKKSETFRNIVQTAFKVVQAAGSALWDTIKVLWGAFRGMVGWIADKAFGVFRAYFNIVSTVALGVAKIWVWMIDKVMAGIGTFLKGLAWLDDRVGGKIPGDFRAASDAVDRWRGNLQQNSEKVFAVVERVKDKINGIPKDVKTKQEFDDKKARGDITKYKDFTNREMDKIRDEKVNVSLNAQAQQIAKSLISVVPFTNRAGGGAVFGPGTETSDSIPVRLSRNEHVWSAEEVKRAGGHDAMRKMRELARNGFLRRIGDLPGLRLGGAVEDAELLPELQERGTANAVGYISRFIGNAVAATSRSVSRLFNRALTFAPVGASPGTGGRLTWGQVARGQTFARGQAGKPYVWGGVGPFGYDCSGFVGAVLNAALGMYPYSRRGTTGTMPWAGFGGRGGKYAVGWFTGDPGHMAGNMGGLPVESAGGVGSRVGSSVTPLGSFPRVASYDSGGFLQPGVNLALNKSGQPEPVLTNRQWQKIDRLIQTLVQHLGRGSHFVQAARDLKADLKGYTRQADRMLGRLSRVTQRRSAFAEAVTSPFRNNDALFEVTDAGGGFSLDDFIATLVGQRRDARRFRRDLRTARSSGLSGGLFNLLARSGNTVAASVFAGMGRMQIGDLEGLFASRNQALTSLGNFAGRTVFGPEQKALRGSLNRLERTINRLIRQFNRLERRGDAARASRRTARRRALGGPVWPGDAFLVGEHQAEVLEFDRSGYVRPTGASSGGPAVIEVRVYLDGRELRESLLRLKRKNGAANLGLA